MKVKQLMKQRLRILGMKIFDEKKKKMGVREECNIHLNLGVLGNNCGTLFEASNPLPSLSVSLSLSLSQISFSILAHELHEDFPRKR